MANLLNFSQNRNLEFSPNRELGFDLDRVLGFDSDREIGFKPNRDLGFGKRGVLFRGFRCANCGALTTPEATECDECGAVFEDGSAVRGEPRSLAQPSPFGRTAPPKVPAARPPAPAPVPPPPPAAMRPPAPYPPAQAPSRYPPPSPYAAPFSAPRPVPPAPTPAPASPSAAHFCPNCGARSWSGDAFCWNCGARFTGSTRVVTASPSASQVHNPPTAEAVKLPPKTARKVVKDWRETGKTLSEYAEEK